MKIPIVLMVFVGISFADTGASKNSVVDISIASLITGAAGAMASWWKFRSDLSSMSMQREAQVDARFKDLIDRLERETMDCRKQYGEALEQVAKTREQAACLAGQVRELRYQVSGETTDHGLPAKEVA